MKHKKKIFASLTAIMTSSLIVPIATVVSSGCTFMQTSIDINASSTKLCRQNDEIEVSADLRFVDPSEINWQIYNINRLVYDSAKDIDNLDEGLSVLASQDNSKIILKWNGQNSVNRTTYSFKASSDTAESKKLKVDIDVEKSTPIQPNYPDEIFNEKLDNILLSAQDDITTITRDERVIKINTEVVGELNNTIKWEIYQDQNLVYCYADSAKINDLPEGLYVSKVDDEGLWLAWISNEPSDEMTLSVRAISSQITTDFLDVNVAVEPEVIPIETLSVELNAKNGITTINEQNHSIQIDTTIDGTLKQPINWSIYATWTEIESWGPTTRSDTWFSSSNGTNKMPVGMTVSYDNDKLIVDWSANTMLNDCKLSISAWTQLNDQYIRSNNIGAKIEEYKCAVPYEYLNIDASGNLKGFNYSYSMEECNVFNTLVIPNTVKSIESEAFMYAFNSSSTGMSRGKYLKYLEFEKNSQLETIGSYAFAAISNASSWYSSLTGKIYIPKSVKNIGGHAFYGCVFVDWDITDQGNDANRIKYTSLDSDSNRWCIGEIGTGESSDFIPYFMTQNFDIMEGTYAIANSAFYHWKSNPYVFGFSFPSSLKSVGDRALYNCWTNALEFKVSDPNTIEFQPQSFYHYSGSNTGKITVPNSTTEQQMNQWKDKLVSAGLASAKNWTVVKKA